MKVLAVLVHPSPVSFCGQILDNVVMGLKEAGHEVRTADLYAEGFNPLYITDDNAQFAGEPMPEDVLREQARVEWSEGLVFVMPIWWYQYPAMFKGWIDRVFSQDWAFRRYGDCLIGDRKTLLIGTAGGNPASFAKYDYDKGLEALWGRGVWGYCGFKDFRNHTFWRVSPHNMPDETRAQFMAEARELGRGFANT